MEAAISAIKAHVEVSTLGMTSIRIRPARQGLAKKLRSTHHDDDKEIASIAVRVRKGGLSFAQAIEFAEVQLV